MNKFRTKGSRSLQEPSIYCSLNPQDLLRNIQLSTYLFAETQKIRVEEYHIGSHVDKMSLTRACKLLACFTDDLKYLSGIDISPLFIRINNPYGIVPVLPKGVLLDEITYLYNPSLIRKTESMGCWTLNEEGDRKFIETLIEPNSIKQHLIFKPFEHGGGYSKPALSNVRSLAKIYAKLDTIQLNILASLRTMDDVLDCLNYAYAVWIKKFKKLIKAKDNPNLLTHFMKRIIISCQQIEKKMQLYHNDLPDLKNLLNELNDEKDFEDDYTNDLLESFDNSIEIWDDSHTLAKILTAIYSTNRLKLYEITKNLSKELDRNYKTDICNSDEYKNLIDTFTIDPVIELESNISLTTLTFKLDEESINEVLKEFINDFEDDIGDGNSNIEKITGKKIDWEITDGVEDTDD